MWFKSTAYSVSKRRTIGLAVLLSTAWLLPAHAADVWKIDLTRSKFSATGNTLVLERVNERTDSTAATGNSTTGTFLVISNGNLYMAKDETAANAWFPGSIRKIDYANWKGMSLVQIGERVRPTNICGFHCQAGLPETHMTYTFKATGGDPTERMGKMVVFND